MVRIFYTAYLFPSSISEMLRLGVDYWTGRGVFTTSGIMMSAHLLRSTYNARSVLEISKDVYFIVDSGGNAIKDKGELGLSPEAIYMIQEGSGADVGIVLDYPFKSNARITRDLWLKHAHITRGNIERVLRYVEKVGGRLKLYLVLQDYHVYTNFKSIEDWYDVAVKPFIENDLFIGIALAGEFNEDNIMHGLRWLSEREFLGFKRLHILGLSGLRVAGLYAIRDVFKDLELVTFDSASNRMTSMSGHVLGIDMRRYDMPITRSARVGRMFRMEDCMCPVCKRFMEHGREEINWYTFSIVHSTYALHNYSQSLDRDFNNTVARYGVGDIVSKWRRTFSTKSIFSYINNGGG